MENIIYALIWTAIAIAASAAAGFHAGRHSGFTAGLKKGEETSGGWEDEAMWWRKNATSIAERDARQAANTR